MAFSDAERLVRLCGAGRFLCLGMADRLLAHELMQRGALVDAEPVPATRYDCIVIEASSMADHGALVPQFDALRGVPHRFMVVRFEDLRTLLLSSRDFSSRASWEDAAIAAGYRRAPQAVSVDGYCGECNSPQVPALLEFERIPAEGLAARPMEKLLADRDLHMDMSRESGPRSDAHMVRYALAASLVRPGDTVLDCACGLGYGSAILAAQSRGSRFIGIDIDPESVAYASAHFSGQYGVEYMAASATDLTCIETASIDLLVSFETIEHLEDYTLFLEQAARVLKSDGRIIASVPNLWVDETGHDPNPYHFHAFDYAKFRDALAARFLVEDRWAQAAPGGFKLWESPRTLVRLPLDAPANDTEWLILAASSDPLGRRHDRPYRCPAYRADSALPGSWLADFGAHYDNPWLYRAMVQMGERIRDRDVLADLAARALGEVAPASADFGAALTVLAYTLLEQPDSPYVADALELVGQYAQVDSDNPHVRRWQVSSVYAGAKLALAQGDREMARALFGGVAQADFMAFSPLLATKTVAACFMLGAMSLAEGDRKAARERFAEGVAAARRALHADDLNAIGNPEAPYAFGFSELAEVADMGAQCAKAIEMLPLHARSPGLFWQQVDTKRFGLVTWALAMERELARLRKG